MNHLKIKKNDTVVILSGKDKGKQGKVLGTVPSDETCTESDPVLP